jgi:hypothetical protein
MLPSAALPDEPRKCYDGIISDTPTGPAQHSYYCSHCHGERRREVAGKVMASDGKASIR